MSKISVKTINCSHCGKEIKVKVYNSINVSLDYELREKLLNNELTNIICDCGGVMGLRYPILYHKMNFMSSVMIHYTQLDKEEAKKQHEKAKQFIGGLSFNNFLLAGIQSPLKEQGINTGDVYEVYNDWDEFIKRVKEIG